MYCDFFGLKAPPFNNTPDPRFFFNTPDHEEALASLLYTAEERKGFVLVTGEVGAGKTLLSRLLLTRLRIGTKTAVITNTRLRGNELLLAICREFDLDVDDHATSAELSHTLEKFLLEQYAKDRIAVLILDEAQNLPLESFEEIRMLGNLEADNAKLLQVLILGQPELQATFRLPEMRQLFQRIFRTFHLRELSQGLSNEYIQHRLTVAGHVPGRRIFEPEALKAIHQYAEGIPRLINQICDNALLAAYTDSARSVAAGIIHEVVTHMMSLTVDDADQKPRGAFARQAMGIPHPTPDTRHPTSDIPHPTSHTPPDLAAAQTRTTEIQARLEGMDAEMRRMIGRLETSERKVADVHRLTQALDPEEREALLDLEAIHDNLDAVRTMRQQVADMLSDAKAATDETRNRLHEWLDQARLSAERVQQQATASLTKTESQASAIREQTIALWEELRSRGQGERSELDESIEQTKLAAQSAQQQLHAIVAEARKQTMTLRQQSVGLYEQLNREGESQNKRISALLSDNRCNADAAHKILDDLETHSRSRTDEFDRRSREMLTFLEERSQNANKLLEDLHETSKTRGDRFADSMDDFLKKSRHRVESAHQQLVEIVSGAQFEVETARKAMSSEKEQMLAEAESTRARTHELLCQTQDILVKTREQSNAMLSDLNVQVAERTRLAEHMCSTAVADGAQTLNGLKTELAEARLQADKARSDLESLIAAASAQMQQVRTGLDSDLRLHHAELTRLRKDAGSIRTDLGANMEDARRELEESMERHRRQMQDLRQMSKEIIDEADSVLASANAQANTSIESVRSELASASDSAARQMEDIRRRMDTEITAALKLGEESLSKSQETARRLRDELQSTMGILQRQAAELHDQLDVESERVRREFTGISNVSGGLLDDTRRRMESLSRLAASTMEEFDQRTGAARSELKKEIDVGQDRVRYLLERLKAEADSCERQCSERVVASCGELAAQITEKIAAKTAEMSRWIADAGKDLRSQIDGGDQRLKVLLERIEATATSCRDQIAAQGAGISDNLVRQTADMSAQVETIQTCLRQNLQAGRSEVEVIGDTLRAQIASQRQSLGEQLAQKTLEMKDLLEDAALRLRDDLDAGDDRVTALLERLRAGAQACVEKSLELLNTEREDVARDLDRGNTAIRERMAEASGRCQTLVADLDKNAAVLRTSIEESSSRCEALLGDLKSIQSNMTTEIEAIRQRLTAQQDGVRQNAAELAAELAETLNRTARMTEQLQTRVSETLNQTDGRILSAAGRAEKICSELEGSVEFLQQRAVECQTQQDAESARIQRELTEVVDRNRKVLDVSQEQVDVMTRRAAESTESLTLNLERLRQTAQTDLTRVGQELRRCIGEAVTTVDRIRGESDAIAADLARRSDTSRQQADHAVSRAEKAIVAIRDQSKNSLAEVRNGLLQMNERAELLQRDLARVSDDVRLNTQGAMDQLRETAGGIASQIDSLRESAQRDAEANFRRLSTLRQQVEQGAESIRLNAGKLLDQVQAGTAAMRQQAEELLTGAQRGADKVGEQAAKLLAQAQTTAERFKDQAESLLERAEATTDAVREDIHSLRDDVMQETERLQQEITKARRDVSETRDESRDVMQDALKTHKNAQEQSQQLIQRAETIQAEARQLLSMPKEIVAEANRHAASLSEMSKKVSTIVKQLSDANAKAQTNKQAIDTANHTADTTLTHLKKNTARVGQLVGIIRQLYGMMDARIEKMRSKLDKADQLCRSVPNEIDGLREVLAGEVGQVLSGEVGQVLRLPPSQGGAGGGVSDGGTTPRRAAPAKPKPPAPAPRSPVPANALGQLVQRNQKLNEWLRDTLGQVEEQLDDTTAADQPPTRDMTPSNIPTAKH